VAESAGFDLHFEWDAVKAESNVTKHGVSFGVAASVLRDPLAVAIFDSEHSGEGEVRWVTIGTASTGGLFVVIHTWEDIGPNSAKVRILSARKATKQEQRNYQEGK
jgi:uncharacterized DUF497 family protein